MCDAGMDGVEGTESTGFLVIGDFSHRKNWFQENSNLLKGELITKELRGELYVLKKKKR